jgi:hypothetical protein
MEERVEEHSEGEDEERHDGVTPIREGRHQDDTREHRRPDPEDEDRPPWAMAEAHEPMVQVLLVGLRQRCPARRPAHDGESGIDDGHAQDEERDQQRGEEEVGLAAELVGGATPDGDGGRGHQESQEHRTAVAHEHLGRVEVVG